MVKLSLILAILVALQLTEAKKNVDKINDYLITSCATRDFGKNIQALKTYLAAQEKKNSCFSCKGLTEDLRNLVALEAIESGVEPCSVESRRVLGACVKLVGNAIKKAELNHGYTLLTRLEWLLVTAQEKHEKVCGELYPKQLKRLVASLDADLIERATVATSDLVARRVVVSGLGKLGDRLDCEYGHAGLLKLLKQRKDPELEFLYPINNERGKRLVNKEKFAQIFNANLVEPCRYYIEQIGKPFFSPQWEDFERFRGSLAHTWRILKVCTQVEQYSDRFLANMINFVSSER